MTTINCSYSVPVIYNGTAPTNHSDEFQFSSSSCTISYSTSTYDFAPTFSAGEVVLGVTALFLAALLVYGFLWFSTRGVKIKQ